VQGPGGTSGSAGLSGTSGSAGSSGLTVLTGHQDQVEVQDSLNTVTQRKCGSSD
jgi:type VI protein secretion system component Hcp